jgi:manganese/zinc/iron transport system substrate-binding protein
MTKFVIENVAGLPLRAGMSRLLVCVLLLATVGLPAATARLRVVTTTSIVTDLVRQVAGDFAQVEGLMGPGVDPHLYKPTAADIVRLQRAEVIFYNGLMLEGRMTDVFTKLARSKRHVYAVTESIPEDELLQPAAFEGHFDPHVWFDVQLWAKCVDTVVAGLAAADSANADAYRRQGEAVRARLAALHAWARAKADELPAERRVLVTSHDAYNYFGRAYGFTVVGLQGISTATEAGLADVARLSDFIRTRGVKAVFVESSVSPATIERVARDSGARVGGELFSDAMGEPGQIEGGYNLGTYEGMIKHNLSTIVDALK